MDAVPAGALVEAAVFERGQVPVDGGLGGGVIWPLIASTSDDGNAGGGEWVADARMRARVAEDAARLRMFVRDGVINSPSGLRVVLHDAVAAAARNGITVTADLAGADQAPEPVLLAIAGSVNETLTNVAKHSGVQTATLTITRERESVEITVVDRGRGFDVKRPARRNGPASIRARAHGRGRRPGQHRLGPGTWNRRGHRDSRRLIARP